MLLKNKSDSRVLISEIAYEVEHTRLELVTS